MKKRYEGLDGLRGLASIGIVLCHIQANANHEINHFFASSLIPSMGDFVFLFMTISGFGMCCGYYERVINNQFDINGFYKKRFVRIWPFFAMVCLLDFVTSVSKNALYELTANLTMFFGFLPTENVKIIGVGWFLGILFIFYYMFPFYVFLLSNKRRAWFSFIVAIILNYVSRYYFGCQKRVMAFSFVYFLAGGMVYLYKDAMEKYFSNTLALLILILITTVVFFKIYDGTITILVFDVLVLIYGMNISDRHIFNSKPLRFLGDISFEIYLCHMMFITTMIKLGLCNLTGNAYIDFGIVVVTVLIGAIIFAFVGKKIVNKIVGLI
ncbi:Predicted acyltransferases [Butyrivibrio fibrisolvens 16/4]|nr:Predicted acyltransferases [Butyrivibrio fibrisolvens 16/4]